jgi:hypothetical protein
MAGKKVQLRPLKGSRAAETLCTGLIAQVATLGLSFGRMAEAMTAEELQAHIRAMEHLDVNAVFPDAVQFVSAIFARELNAREAGKLVHIPNPPAVDPETY